MYKNTAFILKNAKARGSDHRITVFTENWGKISIYVKSYAKEKNKYFGRLEVPSKTEVMFSRSRFSHDFILTGLEQKNAYCRLASDPGKFCWMSIGLEATERFLPWEEAHPLLFRWWNWFLNVYEEKDLEASLLVYLLRLISLSGFHPPLGGCTLCGEAKAAYYSLSPQLELYCFSCSPPVASFYPLFVIEYLRRIKKSDFNKQMNTSGKKEILAFLADFIEKILDQKLKAYTVWKSCAGKGA
ncbi:MAG TPA: DNA repair protein RecO [bacterium]|nr:DNA repair protein RecO [bacterium]